MLRTSTVIARSNPAQVLYDPYLLRSRNELGWDTPNICKTSRLVPPSVYLKANARVALTRHACKKEKTLRTKGAEVPHWKPADIHHSPLLLLIDHGTKCTRSMHTHSTSNTKVKHSHPRSTSSQQPKRPVRPACGRSSTPPICGRRTARARGNSGALWCRT